SACHRCLLLSPLPMEVAIVRVAPSRQPEDAVQAAQPADLVRPDEQTEVDHPTERTEAGQSAPRLEETQADSASTTNTTAGGPAARAPQRRPAPAAGGKRGAGSAPKATACLALGPPHQPVFQRCAAPSVGPIDRAEALALLREVERCFGPGFEECLAVVEG